MRICDGAGVVVVVRSEKDEKGGSEEGGKCWGKDKMRVAMRRKLRFLATTTTGQPLAAR